jgi:uncharacterized membrane protein YphA (DoxX/SURF4 family)
MTMHRDPDWVGALLEWPWTPLLARLALVSAFLVGGIDKLLDFHGAVAEQEHFGLHPGLLWAIVTIVVELGGAVLIILGRLVWLASGALGVLTFVAMLVANNFWDLEGAARFQAFNSFFEHLGLIGGFVLLAHLSVPDRRMVRSI